MIENAQEQRMLNFHRSQSDDGFRESQPLQIVATGCIFGVLPSFPLDSLSLKYCQIQEFNPNNVTVRRFHYCEQMSVRENVPDIDVGALKEGVFSVCRTDESFAIVDIIDCEFIADVSCFRNIAKLHLRYCFSVTDVM
jgi:hypothetical protein